MNQDIIISVNAGEDLSASQYYAVEIDGTIAGNGHVAVGLLQNKPRSGEDASLLTAGRSKFKAGGAVAAGGRLDTAANGFMSTAASGSPSCGYSLVAVASGGIAEGVFNFVNRA